jgi:hypothetical protein
MHIKHLIIILFIILINFLGYSQEIKMNGQIVDENTLNSIELVNIGILNKNLGTVTNMQGKFDFIVSKNFENDSITISHISYYTIKIPVKNFKNEIISLKPRTNQLSEIVLATKKKRTKKVGVKTYNPLLWLGGISKDNDIIENA